MNPTNAAPLEAATITLNPAIDRTVTISNFTAGAVNRVEAARNNPGGKGVNVASALADTGHRVAATGFLGRENSASFEQLFRDKGIEDRFVRIAGQTRVGIKISDPVLHQTTDINFPGVAPAPEDMTALREAIRALDAKWFVLAGSLPPGVSPGIYRELLLELNERGCRVALDASGEALRLALDARPRLFKPNIHELGELLGRTLEGERQVIDAARELVATGIEMVVVSMGKDGACFVTASETVVAIPPSVVVHSTVGAGDAMVAGIISAQLQGLGLAECARLATAFSVHALTRRADHADFSSAIQPIRQQVHTR